MLKHSEPLKGKKDKYVNGYGPDSESEEEEVKKEEEKEEEKQEESPDFEKKVDEIEDLFSELDELLKEYQDENKHLDNIISENMTFIDEELDELSNRVKLEGSGKNTAYLPRPNKNDPEILYSLYNLIEHYKERKYNIEKEINKKRKEATQSIASFKGLEDSYNQIKSEIEDEIIELEQDSDEPPLTSKEKSTLDELKEKLKKYSDSFEESRLEKNKKWTDYDNYSNNGLTGYNNLIYELTEKYRSLRLNISNVPTTYALQNKLKDQISDVLQLIADDKKMKLNEISDEGKKARVLYQQLMVTKHKDHKKLTETDIIKNEDAYRSEYLYKKLYVPKAYPNAGIDITDKAFYRPYDIDTKKSIIELKTAIQHKGQKELRFFISKDKIEKLIEEGEKQSKTPKVYWYIEPEKGYLSSMSKAQLDKISKEEYGKRLYKLTNIIDKDTFTDKDIYNSKGNINQVTYMIKAGDPRITKVIT